MTSHQPTRLVPILRVCQVYRMPASQILDVIRYIGMRPIHYDGELVLTGKSMSSLSRFVSRTSRQYGDTIARLRKSFPDAPRIDHEDYIGLLEAAA